MNIYKAAVIGAGTMGAEIAQVISFAGIPVLLKDVNQEVVNQGLEKVRKIYERRLQKGKMTASEVEEKIKLVQGATGFDAFSDVDIVIEAVPERMELKKKVFQEVEAHVSEDAILATNTSALSISELGSVTRRAEKVVGMHFFFPAHVMKLVEVIPGLATSDETVDDVVSFSEALHKMPVRVNECAGFLVNRLLMPYLNEAAYCLEEGTATAKQIDQAAVAFGFPMGPFQLVDQLGLDVCADVVKVLMASYGNRMAPAQIWSELYGAGRYGVKSGAGFYEYDKRGSDEFMHLLKRVQRERGSSTFDFERILYLMVNEAVLCLEEHVSSASDIDLAMVAGIGFPQDKEGILHFADQVGLDQILTKLMQCYEQHGARFWPAPLLRRMVGAGFLGKARGRGFFEYST